MNQYRIYVTDGRHASYDIEREMLSAIGGELKICHCETDADIAAQCADADGILLDMAPMTARAVAALKKCKVISRYGVGYDNVDVAACIEQGIQVANVPDYCAEDVSDHALALLFACLRDVPRRDRLIRQGQWNIQRMSFRLSGKVLGVLGFGRIAKALVRKCAGFHFSKILVYDPYVSERDCIELGARKVALDDVLRESDIISLHMPVTAETVHMIDGRALALMKPTTIFINTSRGRLVDDAWLVKALKRHQILCAGLDTHNLEPLPLDSPYLCLDNVVLTDHTAYNTEEAVEELKRKCAQNVINVLTGLSPAYPVSVI